MSRKAGNVAGKPVMRVELQRRQHARHARCCERRMLQGARKASSSAAIDSTSVVLRDNNPPDCSYFGFDGARPAGPI